MKKGTLKQAFAMFLAMTLLFTSVPTNVFASTMQNEEETLETETVYEENVSEEEETTAEEVVEEETVIEEVTETTEETTTMLEESTVPEELVEETTEIIVEETTEAVVEESTEIVMEETEEVTEEDIDEKEADSSGFSYKVVTGKNIAITAYNGSDTVVVIPETIGEYTVTEIAAEAFYGKTAIVSVVIPDAVTSIGENAFYNCTNLETVDLPSKLQTLCEYAFANCTSLKEIVIPKRLTTVEDAFLSGTNHYGPFTGCTNLKKVVFEEGIVIIPTYILSGCVAVTDVQMPDTVKGIGYYAFANCIGLKNVTIPDTVTAIGEYAFANCTNLESIKLSSALQSIYGYAFYNCTSLKEIVIPKTVTDVKADSMYGDGKEGPFTGCINLKKVVFEEGTKEIPAFILLGCTAVMDVQMPDTVETIGERAFAYCTGIESIKMPDSVTTIGRYAFSGCTGLETVDMPSKLQKIYELAFFNCSSLQEIVIPKTLTYTGTGLVYGSNGKRNKCGPFANCIGLKNVVFEEGIQTIPAYILSGCTGEIDVQMPDTVKTIEEYAFAYCSGMESIRISYGTTSIGSYAFYDCTYLEEIYVPETVKEVGSYVFSNCSYVKIYAGKDAWIITYAKERNIPYEIVSIPVETIKLNVTKAELQNSKTLQLHTIVTPEFHTDKITWKSSDKNIATVSADGLVTAKKLGKVTITVTASSGKKATCTIEVVPLRYKITYKLDGGKNHKSNPATYYKEMSTIKLKNPTKTGYTFKGWYSDSKFKTKVSEIKKGSTGNKTLYAKWAVNKYNISFNGNKATSGKMSALADKKYGSTFALTKNTFKRTGYKFVGWNTKADGKGTAYTDGAKVKNLTSSNGTTVTLYAQWEKQKYSITYKLDGGKNSSKNPTSYTITTSTIKLQNPTKANYTFGGWYSDSKFKNKVSEIKKGSTGTKTFYAKWIKNKYAIKFDGNGATSGKMSTVKDVAVDKTVTLTNNAFKKTGYKFVGWNTKKDGKGDSYTNKQKVKGLSKSNGKTVTLYAQWEKQKYSISYKLDGGKNNSKNPANYTITTSTIKLQNPTKTGYTFKGWYSDSKLTKKVNEIKKGSTGSKTLYAKWAVNKYNIKFNGNGSTSGKMSTLSNRTYDKSYTLPTNAYKRTGYEFTGWNTKADGTGKIYANKASVKNLLAKNAATVTLYAQWSKIVESNFTFGEVDYGDGLAVTGLAEGVKLTKIEIPASYKGEKVTTIAQMAFEENKDITSVVIPEGITGIYNFSFANCTSITELVLPDSVTKIYNGAFMGCTGLTSIELPDNIEELVACPFGNCTNLTSVVYKGVTYTSKSAIYAALEENGVFTTNAMMPFSGTGLAD